MERSDVILLAGTIAGLIWMGACVIIEGKNRKYVIIAGAMIDIVLLVICRNCGMLFIGVLGGLFCGLFGFFYSARKYETAVREMKGVKNWVIVCIIFFVMLCMTMSIAYPELFHMWLTKTLKSWLLR